MDYKYWAFISYSHRDKAWGDWLHRTLETYRVPPRLVGRETRDPDCKIPARIAPIFRDREELPTASNLGQMITTALTDSRYLVVLCSPNSAPSRWVNEEILTFKRMGRSDRILSLIVDGEPNATDKPGMEGLECFPPALRFEVGPEGDLSNLRTEPIAADARPGKDAKPDARLKIIAGILGVGFDELKQREMQRRQRRLIAVTSAALAVMVVTVGLAIAAMVARADAVVQKTKAEKSDLESRHRLVRMMVAKGVAVWDREDAAAALPWFVEALRIEPDKERNEDLHRMRIASVLSRCPVPVRRDLHAGDSNYWYISPDCKRLLTFANRYPSVAGDKPPDPNEPVKLKSEVAVMDAPTGKPLYGSIHVPDDMVSGAEFSHDSRFFLLQIGFTSVRLFTAADGQPAGPLINVGNRIHRLALSPDGSRLLVINDVVSENEPRVRAARLWNTHHGQPLSPYIRLKQEQLETANVTRDVELAAFSPDGRRFALATRTSVASRFEPGVIDYYGGFQVHDAETGDLLTPHVSVGSTLKHLAFSPDGYRIVSCDSRVVNLWDSENGGLLVGPITHISTVNHAAFDPTGTRLLTSTAGSDSLPPAAQIWDSRTAEPLGPPMICPAAVSRSLFSPDGLWVLSVCTLDNDLDMSGSVVQVWDADTGRPLSPPLRNPKTVTDARFTPDRKHLLFTTESGDAISWDIQSLQGPQAFKFFSNPVHHEWVSPDGKVMVSDSLGRADVGSKGLWFHNALTGKLIHGPVGEDQSISRVAFSHDSKQLIAVADGSQVRVWDVATARPLSPPVTFKGDVYYPVGFSPDSSLLFVATESELHLLHPGDLRPACPPIAVKNCQSVEFSADSTRVAVLSWDGVHVCETRTGRVLLHLPSGGSDATSLSPDGKRLTEYAASDSHKVALWDVDTGKTIHQTLDHSHIIASVAASPDSRLWVTAANDRSVRIWDAATLKTAAPPIVMKGVARSLNFTPDSRVLLIGGDNSTLRLWDTSTGEPLSDFFFHIYPPHNARLSDDRQRLIADSGANTTVWLFPREDRPLQDLALLAQVVSSSRFDDSGNLTALDDASLRAAWADWLKKYPQPFEIGEPVVPPPPKIKPSRGKSPGANSPGQNLPDKDFPGNNAPGSKTPQR